MEVVPAAQLDEARFLDAHAVVARCEARIDPAVPPVTVEEFRRQVDDDRMDANEHQRHAVVDGTDVRAVLHLEFELDDANDHLASCEIFGAAADHEAGRAALCAALDIAAADGRTTLIGFEPDTVDGNAFWTDLGAPKVYDERVSALDVTAVDPGLMANWIERRTERAADLALHRWTGACPEALVETFAASRTLMNGAPMEGVDYRDVQVTVADVREDEDALRSLGLRAMNVMAVAPDGTPAGHTQVYVNPFRPAASAQWETAVDPGMRRRGVGRWLKAEMWRWLRSDEPEVTRLTTGNAEVNAAMLSLNVEMGYRAIASYGIWQRTIAEFRSALG